MINTVCVWVIRDRAFIANYQLCKMTFLWSFSRLELRPSSVFSGFWERCRRGVVIAARQPSFKAAMCNLGTLPTLAPEHSHPYQLFYIGVRHSMDSGEVAVLCVYIGIPWFGSILIFGIGLLVRGVVIYLRGQPGHKV